MQPVRRSPVWQGQVRQLRQRSVRRLRGVRQVRCVQQLRWVRHVRPVRQVRWLRVWQRLPARSAQPVRPLREEQPGDRAVRRRAVPPATPTAAGRRQVRRPDPVRSIRRLNPTLAAPAWTPWSVAPQRWESRRSGSCDPIRQRRVALLASRGAARRHGPVPPDPRDRRAAEALSAPAGTVLARCAHEAYG